MEEIGYIKLYRKIFKWKWYKDSKTVHLFLHCLLKANYKEKKWNKILVKRGSFLTSYNQLCQETGLSYQSMRTSLQKLELTHELTHEATNQYTLVSIHNYDQYQVGNVRGNVQDIEGNVRINARTNARSNARDIPQNSCTTDNNKPPKKLSTHEVTHKATHKVTTTNKYKEYNSNSNNKLLLLLGDKKSPMLSKKFLPDKEAQKFGNELVNDFLKFIKEYNNGVTPVAVTEKKRRQVVWNILQRLGVRNGMKTKKDLPPDVRNRINRFMKFIFRQKARKNYTIEKIYTLKTQVNNFLENFNNE